MVNLDVDVGQTGRAGQLAVARVLDAVRAAHRLVVADACVVGETDAHAVSTHASFAALVVKLAVSCGEEGKQRKPMSVGDWEFVGPYGVLLINAPQSPNTSQTTSLDIYFSFLII